MIKWIKWQIAYLADWYYGDKVCWPRLALWAGFDGNRDDLSYSFSGTKQCRRELAHFGGECYCCKIVGLMPSISPEFLLRGKR